ncbi:MAG: peptidoglycan DD-metalloendopeptidase family protein [Myxococcales bacterium]|nr:peptidoglycan DD-metalloendopeptidase family protein [Myxococcales bacterium]
MRGWRRRLVIAALGLGALALPVEARGGPSPLGELLRTELGLAQQAVALEEALTALEREREGAEYGAELLHHASRESLRRLAAYREGQEPRERLTRQRARAMVKASRGGVARLIFEDVGGDERASAERLSRGRMLRWLVRHDLHELAAYQRSEERARDELLRAHRELQALSALATVHAVEGDLVAMGRKATGPALARAHQQTRRALSITPAHLRSDDERERLQQLDEAGRELRALRRGGRSLHRPVRGPITGRFGEYTDPVLKLPMARNGIELRARRDEPVHAPADGTVVMVASLPGFEQVVVIDHGNGELLMLGRLWKTTVAEGDTVSAGQEIARVAPKTTDDGLGTTAYLELRHGDKPVDPEPWLRY